MSRHSAMAASRAWIAASPGSTTSSDSTLGTVDVGTDSVRLQQARLAVGLQALQSGIEVRGACPAHRRLSCSTRRNRPGPSRTGSGLPIETFEALKTLCRKSAWTRTAGQRHQGSDRDPENADSSMRSTADDVLRISCCVQPLSVGAGASFTYRSAHLGLGCPLQLPGAEMDRFDRCACRNAPRSASSSRCTPAAYKPGVVTDPKITIPWPLQAG
jgi:hypothetical protein